jgi:methylated-DNA-protein-cysteine methyltransferase related protein
MQNKTKPVKLNLFTRIHEIVAQIPKGKVATYGQIAELAGTKDARKVGWALCKNEDPKIPCHRVLKKGGFLVENYAFGDWQDEKAKLMNEGINFIAEKQVDIEKHKWNGETQN